MSVGTSTGEYHEDEFDALLSLHGLTPPGGKAAGMPPRATEKPAGELKPTAPMGGSQEGLNIDRDHHVPLVASAIIDDKGDMQGMAIDHRVPPKPEYEKHLWDHEQHEVEYMKHLLKIGYNEQDAYHKAHDWSTQRESAAVEAEFGKDGLEAYKQHWRDAASVAKEPTDRDRHPDAHTTKYGLDESELGTQKSMVGDFYNWVTGKDKTYTPPKDKEFPTHEEAAFADRSGFAYGKSWENYFKGNIARIVGETDPDVYDYKGKKLVHKGEFEPAAAGSTQIVEKGDQYSKLLDLTDPKYEAIRDQMQGVFSRAAVAANRHPISALGFSPEKTLMDVVAHDAGIAGLTSRQKDQMYVNQHMDMAPVTAVHESIHNGIKKILDADPDLKEEVRKQGPMFEEYVVRHIMDTTMGGHEESMGPLAKSQVELSRGEFMTYRYYQEIVDKLTAKAQEIIGQQKGPK